MSANAILEVIYDVIGQASNFVRIRGYTDNQPINNEIFSSNWELSVSRATAILRVLEDLTMNPARMAVEGYGQYYPEADNTTTEGRAQNRRVVIAISKYGLDKINLLDTPTISVEDVEAITQVGEDSGTEEENKIRIIRLENGGIRITTRKDEQQE